MKAHHKALLQKLPPTEQDKIKNILDQLPTGYVMNAMSLSREGMDVLFEIISDEETLEKWGWKNE